MSLAWSFTLDNCTIDRMPTISMPSTISPKPSVSLPLSGRLERNFMVGPQRRLAAPSCWLDGALTRPHHGYCPSIYPCHPSIQKVEKTGQALPNGLQVSETLSQGPSKRKTPHKEAFPGRDRVRSKCRSVRSASIRRSTALDRTRQPQQR